MTRAEEERGMNRQARTQVEFRMRLERVREGTGGRKEKDTKDRRERSTQREEAGGEVT